VHSMHCICLAFHFKVRIETLKPIPIQVDGEPCLLAPSVIRMGFHSKVPMLRRDKKTPLSQLSMEQRSELKEAVLSSRDARKPLTSVFMQVPILVVGRHDYDTYRDSLDRLKDTGFEIGVIGVEAETDLARVRTIVQKLLGEHPMLPYTPGSDWRFLDYLSNSDEGTFRVSRHHEPTASLSDIANLDECVLLLDEAFPSITDRSAAMVFTPTTVQQQSQPQIHEQQAMVKQSNGKSPQISSVQPVLTRRRISETLRIVLSSESPETHL